VMPLYKKEGNIKFWQTRCWKRTFFALYVLNLRKTWSIVTLVRVLVNKIVQFVTVRKYPAVVQIYKAYFRYRGTAWDRSDGRNAV